MLSSINQMVLNNFFFPVISLCLYIPTHWRIYIEKEYGKKTTKNWKLKKSNIRYITYTQSTDFQNKNRTPNAPTLKSDCILTATNGEYTECSQFYIIYLNEFVKHLPVCEYSVIECMLLVVGEAVAGWLCYKKSFFF